MSIPSDPKLGYRDGRADVPQRRYFAAELIGGIAAGVVAVIICGFVWGFANIYYHPRATTTSFQTDKLNWSGPAICIAIFLAVLALLAWVARRHGRRGLWMGMLIGAGVMLLIEGACFFRSWR